jgi:stage V sporulation protein AA
METPVVYVRLRRRVLVRPESLIMLGQVARLVTDTQDTEQRLSSLPLHQIVPEDGNMIVIDMLQVVKSVRQMLPGTTVETFGEPHVLVEVAQPDTFKPRLFMLVLAWVLLFFGSGMALMNFHADVNMPQVQKRITELITGKPERHPWLFQIPYSLGVGLGMLLFFNRLLRKKMLDEPNPLEVEMFMYQENVNHYIITEEYRKKHEEEEARKRGG